MRFYVGTYSQRGSKGIYCYDLDAKSGALTLLGASGEVANPSFVALHPNGKFLYAVGEGKSGVVGAFAIDSTTGALQFINQQSSRGADPCHVAVDPQGKNVLIANYSSGSVAVLPIGPAGQLAPVTGFVEDQGASKVNPGRQEAPHAHCILPDPGGRFVAACDLGCDRLFVFKYDAASGMLAPNDPPAVVCPPGSGPRHFVFTPNGRHAYVVHELDATVTAYRFDARHGRFDERQVIASLPKYFNGANTAAEIVLHPSGKTLYSTNRGADSIVAFAVEGGGDSLRLLGDTSSGGKTPRGFGIDPSGNFLVCANQDADNLVVFKIDRGSGALAPTGVALTVPAPVCVAFAA